MKSLFAISADLLALQELLEPTDGELTDDQMAATIDAWLNELGPQRDAKLDNYAALIKELEARSEARDAEAKRLLKLSSTDDHTAGRLKDRLKYFFQLHNWKKIDTARFKFTLAGNGGMAPLLVDLPPDKLPPAYQRSVIMADNEAIRAELEAGTELPFARLAVRGQSLRIK